MPEISYTFEELPLGFTEDNAAFEIRAWGEATIDYSADAWIVSKIKIAITKRVDGRWIDGLVELDRTHRLWSTIAAALQVAHKDAINERIVDDMREAGLLPWNPNAEHSTLNHAQQGVSR